MDRNLNSEQQLMYRLLFSEGTYTHDIELDRYAEPHQHEQFIEAHGRARRPDVDGLQARLRVAPHPPAPDAPGLAFWAHVCAPRPVPCW
jgi:hypothetical protein